MSTDALLQLPRSWSVIIITGFMLYQTQTLIRSVTGDFGDATWRRSREFCVWHSCTNTAWMRLESHIIMCVTAMRHLLTLIAAPSAMCALRASVGARRVRKLREQ